MKDKQPEIIDYGAILSVLSSYMELRIEQHAYCLYHGLNFSFPSFDEWLKDFPTRRYRINFFSTFISRPR
jgi:hypothetical protein